MLITAGHYLNPENSGRWDKAAGITGTESRISPETHTYKQRETFSGVRAVRLQTNKQCIRSNGRSVWEVRLLTLACLIDRWREAE